LIQDAGGAVDAALALAQAVAADAPVAVAESLAIARIAAELTEAELAPIEAAAWQRNRATQDYLEGARALAERRPLRWQAMTQGWRWSPAAIMSQLIMAGVYTDTIASE